VPVTTSNTFIEIPSHLHGDADSGEMEMQQQIINCEKLLLENGPQMDFYF